MARKSFTHEGQRYYVRGKNDKDIAVKMAMKKRDLEEGKKRISKNMLVREWSEMYIEKYRDGKIDKNTLGIETALLNNWINPEIGNNMLKDILPIYCQDILNEMANQGMSKSYITKCRRLLKNMFKKACQNRLLIENPAEDLDTPEAEDGTHRPLADYEREHFLKVCIRDFKTEKAMLWGLFMYYCGPRPDEPARIMGAHINLKRCRLFIDGTKTARAKRFVPIPQPFAECLSQLEFEPFEYVLTNRDGKPINKTNRRRMWAKIKKEMHISMGGQTDMGELQRVVEPHMVADDFVPYNLRHNYCTDLERAGVSLARASKLMGHSSVVITAKIYTHIEDDAIDEAARQINAYHPIATDAVPLVPVSVENA